MTTSPTHAHNSSNISALTDFGEDVNPWEMAAHLSMEHAATSRPAPQTETRPMACHERVRQVTQGLDGLVSLLLLVWVGVIWINDGDRSNTQGRLPKTVLILQGSIVTFLWLRMAVSSFQICSSLLLSTLFACLSLYTLIEPAMVQSYLSQHAWLHLPWLAHHSDRLPLLLLGLAAWELIRYSVTRCLLSLEDDDDDRVILLDSPRRFRPWWWRRDSRPLTRPLLDEAGLPDWVAQGRRHRQEQEPTRSWWRRPWRSSANHDGNNVRDDGSVDFASVQEEWASRSEEDPHWWSKEGDERIALSTNARTPGEPVHIRWSKEPSSDRII